MIIFIVPKNSGLEICYNYIDKYVSDGTKIIKVRGEDVPLFVEKLSKLKKNVIGITGEDLFREFYLNNYNTSLKILERIKWKDNNYIYKKPTLCLLGSRNRKFSELGNKLNVCINSKYKKLAKKGILNRLENEGYVFEKIYASGATEEFFIKGIVDLVIDIVCSGKSAEEAGLIVYDKIFESDIVIIRSKNDNSFN